jgi:hypothetical protein
MAREKTIDTFEKNTIYKDLKIRRIKNDEERTHDGRTRTGCWWCHYAVS